MFNGIKTLLRIVLFVIACFVLLHFLALLGVFVALIYPIWWLIMPEKSQCLICNSSSEGKYCPFCEKTVVKSSTVPTTLSSAVKNGALIFLFSLISFALIVLESLVLNKYLLPLVQNRTAVLDIGIADSDKYYYLGEIITVPLNLSKLKQPINAVQLDLDYDNDLLQAVEISTDDSFASIFVDKIIDHEVGLIRISGGIPNPGFTEEQGLFAVVLFRTLKPGAAEIKLLSSSMVLANDGKGSNILSEVSYGANYFILPEFRPNHELQSYLTEPPKEDSAEEVAILFDFSEKTGAVLGESTVVPEENKFTAWLDGLNFIWQGVLKFVIWLDDLIIRFFLGVARFFVGAW